MSDSLSVPTPIKNSFSESRPTLLQETLLKCNQIRTTKVYLIWIPSHVNILGNERTDALAKLSLSGDGPPFPGAPLPGSTTPRSRHS